ncbi:MAG: Amylosucrase [Pseudomonadota bacterium]
MLEKSAAAPTPHLATWRKALMHAAPDRADELAKRIAKQLPILQNRLSRTYGDGVQVEELIEQLLTAAVNIALKRPQALWDLDLSRQAQPHWHQQGAVGYTAYVDHFAGNLRGVVERIDYLKSLGVTYLHLLPFFKAAEGPNDGGFAVANFEVVEPRLGTQDDLQFLTQALRKEGISLCSDFVLNHVAHDHEWAVQARNGNPEFQNFFCLANSEEEVNAWEKNLPQIFPDTAPGNFTYQPSLKKWVWTTFYPYQWDLNYANPQVFLEVVSAMMRVANMGVEAFRLDSTGFLWKRQGTNCQNQAEVHWLLQAMRALMEIACPGVLMKAEAIMPTHQLPPYFGMGETPGPECHLAYHSSMMAASWVSLAEENVSILNAVMQKTPPVPTGSSWLTYVRCHDDIGWNVLRPELQALGDVGYQRLLKASHFFAGLSPESYAQGASFQTTDLQTAHGTNGMASALVGMASAATPEAFKLAVDRLILLQSLSFFTGGLPLLYMGDELGLGNTSAEVLQARQGADGRELHRPDWQEAQAQLRHQEGSVQNLIFQKLQTFAQLRQQLSAFHGDVPVALIETGHPTVLTLKRGHDVMACFNFSRHAVAHAVENGQAIALKPYGFAWLQKKPNKTLQTLID